MPTLVLASGSPYRRELLSRLRQDFTWQAPQIDEGRRPGESATALVRRLAQEKAAALAEDFPAHLIIGSDQVAVLDGQILGKPLTYARAHAQLSAASGNTVLFMTGLALLDSRNGSCQVDCVPYAVHFRTLKSEQIARYLNTETPYDCAGSFKAEGLGISLFRGTAGSDASSLIGLPLIRLVEMLQVVGVQVP
jgi:MAF protein